MKILCRRRPEHGFSLIELAIVLVIVGLLLGGGLVALQSATERNQRQAQERQLREVREALYAFAMSNGRLPCPDSGGDTGSENFDGSDCEDIASDDVAYGALPSATLGVGNRDAWGHRLRYAVHAEYAEDPAEADGAAFDFASDPPTLTVESSADATAAVTLAGSVPAIVVSFSVQGGQVWTSGGLVCPDASAGFSEDAQENCDDNTTFVDAGYREPTDTDPGFEHMLTWLADPLLKARLVDAGRLP